MKTRLLTLLAFTLCIWKTNAQCSGDVIIPNTTFKTYLLNETNINTDGNSQISCNEAEAFTGNIYVSRDDISDLTGIEAFVNLTGLHCGENNLTSLDISNNTALEVLSCYDNNLTSLDVSNNLFLRVLHCGFNNGFTNLDVSNNNDLTSLTCSGNNLTSLDISNNIGLETLSCSNNNLTSLDVSNNTGLFQLYCSENNLNRLDLSLHTQLFKIVCDTNDLRYLNIKNGNTLGLGVDGVSLENNPNLTCIEVDDVAYANTNWSDNKDATASFSETSCATILDGNCTINIPDANFRTALLNNHTIDTNFTGEISCEEAEAYTGSISVVGEDIADATGLETFINLSSFYCGDNALTDLDVSNNTALNILWCNGNDLTSIDVSANTSLTHFRCNLNDITSLDVSANTALERLYCNNNYLTSLNIANGNYLNLAASNFKNNVSLTCIQVDDEAYANANWDNLKDATASYSEDCSTILSTDNLFATTVSISPNPTTTSFNINLLETLKEVEVYTLSGRKVHASTHKECIWQK